MARMKKVHDPSATRHCRRCKVLLVPGRPPEGNCTPSKFQRRDFICRSCVKDQARQSEALRIELEEIGRRVHEEVWATHTPAERAAQRREQAQRMDQLDREDRLYGARQLWPGEHLTLAEIERRWDFYRQHGRFPMADELNQ